MDRRLWRDPYGGFAGVVGKKGAGRQGKKKFAIFRKFFDARK